jgi:hypothetical protein
MKTTIASFTAGLLIVSAPLAAQDPKPSAAKEVRSGDKWVQAISDPAQRGTLHDAIQHVRGDSGKWNDEPMLQHAPPIAGKPPKMSLDDWADQWLDKEFRTDQGDDNWLLVRTRQLDDNDRVWVERIERQGNQFKVVLNEAIWQGRYQKTFTYYAAFGVNLGKLKPGKYEVQCVIQPLAFKQFEGDGRPLDNWPKDERPAEKDAVELRASFQVGQE